MLKGMITRAKNGVAKVIMSSVLMMPIKQESQLRKDMGMVSSIVKMSWNIQRNVEKESVTQERSRNPNPTHTGPYTLVWQRSARHLQEYWMTLNLC